MNSYLNFLSRNKAYAFIDVLGLALSMAFVVLFGAYTWQETHIDSQHTKADRIYLMGFNMDGGEGTGSHWRIQPVVKGGVPGIESSTAMVRNHRSLEKDGENIEMDVLFVDSTFLQIFDFPLLQGDSRTVLSAPNSIVVTEEFARRIWPGEDAIGKTLLFNYKEDPLIVTGIMEPMTNTMFMTSGHTPVDALIPYEMIKYMNYSLYAEGMNNATGAEIFLLAEEGVDLMDHYDEYKKVVSENMWLFKLPGCEDYYPTLYPFKGHYFSEVESSNGLYNHGDSTMVKLLSITGLVILIFALMNYVNLTVALAGRRAKEMATRRLLGDSRQGIMWRLIGEATLLCLVSFAIGVGLAYLAAPYASNLLSVPVDITGCINWVTILAAVGVIVLMGVLAGVVPAWLISSVGPIEAVKGAFRRKNNMVFGKIFIVIQNTVTIVMIACALTMWLQTQHLIHAPLGYETEHILEVPSGGVNKGTAFLDEVRKLGCVENVSACWTAPINRGNNNTMTYEGRTISFQQFQGDENFLPILGIKLEEENHGVNAVKHYLNRQALSELGLGEDAKTFPFYETEFPIDGIVEDFHIGDILSEQHPVMITIIPSDSVGRTFHPWNYLVKVRGDEVEAVGQVVEVFKEVFDFDPSSYMSDAYIDQIIASHFVKQSNFSIIVSIFAVIALIISMLGLVAMSSYYVQQRSREIAIRKVSGSTSDEVLRRFIGIFMKYVGIAVVISVPIIYVLMHNWLSDFSYRIPLYWWIYVVAAAVCVLISMLSVYLQTRQAANANPALSLYQNQ